MMIVRPKLLDGCCGAGGASKGYYRAGFDVTGVDICQQPRYPFRFIQADILEYLAAHGHEYDVIHVSPPCQRYSSATRAAGTQENHPDLLPSVRELLQAIGKPYVIENVPGAPMENYLILCGTMFGLGVVRHRWFEIKPNPILLTPPCCHDKPVAKHGRPVDLEKEFHGISGHFSGVAEARLAMDINWMGQKELAQAIPPAYTEFIGKHLMKLFLDNAA